MRAVVAWLRLDARRRVRSLLALAVLLGLSGALVLAVTAGARRDGSAMERLRAQSLPATATVFPNTPGFDWGEVRALPEVEALALFPTADTYGIEGIDFKDVGYPNASPNAYVDIERGAVLAGRGIDNSDVGEAIANEPFMDKYDLQVGDTVTARMNPPGQLEAHSDDRTPPDPREAKAPTQPLRIVGVVRVPWVFEFGGTFGGTEDAKITASYAFYEKYWATFAPTGREFFFVNALVRLRGGESDLPQFRSDLARLTGRNDIEVTDLAEGAKRVTNATSFERDSLLLFAMCAAVAALLIVGQAIVRHTVSAVTDLDVLRTLGLTKQESVLAASGGPVMAAVVAAVVSAVGAYLASPLFPIGVGAKVEPDPGHYVDWAVLVPGALGLVLVVALIAYLTALNALGHRRADARFRRSTVATVTSRLGFPLPVTLGTRLALETGRGRTAVPVRPAMVGAVAGVLGLVAAATFHVGLADAVGTPERYGQTWQAGGLLGLNGRDFAKPDKVSSMLATLADRPEVAGINDTRAVPVTIAGRPLTMFTLAPLGGGVTPVSLAGHEPQADDEIALAPLTAQKLGVEPGQRVQVKGERTVSLKVSGVTFVPAVSENSYDNGAWVTAATLSRLYPSGFFKYHGSLVRFTDGIDASSAISAIKSDTGIKLDTDLPPADVVNLRTVQALPTLMGAFLALLAMAAVGHALATTVRRRRHDMAVLRALGLTHQQVRATVAWQATTLAIVGLVFGIPLGVALARTLWRVVAERTPVQYVPPLAAVALVLVVPVSVLVANILAAYPGQRAVRQRISTVLRAE